MIETFSLLGGKLQLERTSANPTEDPLWLAATLAPEPHSTVLDAMCGSGIVGLTLLTRTPTLRVTGVDIDPVCTALALRNAMLNHVQHNYTLYTADVLSTTLPPHTFNLICVNPPYHAATRGHNTPNPTKARAHTLPPHALTSWLMALHGLLAVGGTLALIVHTACEAEVLAFARTHTLATTLIPIQTSPTRPAKRLIVHLTLATTYSLNRAQAIPAYNSAVREQALVRGEVLGL
jgi:tRNA1(Val) A37 N6-methylase TrmN6